MSSKPDSKMILTLAFSILWLGTIHLPVEAGKPRPKLEDLKDT